MKILLLAIAKAVLPKWSRNLLKGLYGWANYLLSCQWFTDIPELIKYRRNGLADILFYLQMPVHEEWIATTCKQMRKYSRCDIVLYRRSATSAQIRSAGYYCVSTFAMKYFHASIVVTPASGVPRSWLSPRCKHLVHMPHSLVSLHMVYPPDQFDCYDFVYCCGDHHVQEIQAIWEKRGIEGKQFREIGYGRLDLLKQQMAESSPGTELVAVTQAPVILIAPSWGIKNILTEMGIELIDLLIKEGCRVVLRPHPLFMKSPVLAAIRKTFKGTDALSFEDSNKGNQAIFDADLLISDYSGIAYEYAFLRERPVLFIDVPKKINNLAWRQYDIIPMELCLREKLGVIAPPQAPAAYRAVKELLVSSDDYREEIQKLRARYVYNFGLCAEAAEKELKRLLDKVRTEH